MGFFKSAWDFICKLPVAQYIKPLWKSALKALISNEVENLRGQVKNALATGGVKDVDALFSAFEKRLDDGVAALSLPGPIKAAIATAEGHLDDQLEQGRKMLDSAIEVRGPGAVDASFDAMKSLLFGRIDAL